jgi:hypothetical protein
MNIEKKSGLKCSTNMVFVKRIESMSELMDVFKNDPSVFWIHRPFPCAFVMHQPFIVLVNAIKKGRLWKIEKKQCKPKEKLILDWSGVPFFIEEKTEKLKKTAKWYPFPKTEQK